MIERIRFIQNPLTIIAIFAGLAEIAGTTALALVDKDLQIIFIWFVMGFPLILVALFFITLNFNPTVLYAPSDFEDERNFLRILASKRKLSEDVDLITKQIEITQSKISERLKNDLQEVKDADREKFIENLDDFLKSLQDQLTGLQESADNVVADASLQVSSNSSFQARILDFLSMSKHAMTLDQISSAIGLNKSATKRALEHLCNRNIINCESHDSEESFSIII